METVIVGTVEVPLEEVKNHYKGERTIVYRIVQTEKNPKYKNSLELLLYETDSRSMATAMLAYTNNLIRWRVVRPSKITLYKCEVLKELPTVTYSTEKVGEISTDGLQMWYE